MSKEFNRNRWSKLQVQHTPNRSYRNTVKTKSVRALAKLSVLKKKQEISD